MMMPLQKISKILLIILNLKSDKLINVVSNLWIVWNSDIDTGDSSIGEGMFDGAKLSSITFGSSAVFKSYTALPSTSKGWIETGVMNKGEDDITPTNGGKSFAANLKDATDYS